MQGSHECYLAYFDILGFKEFISNSTEEEIDFGFERLFRDSQHSVAEHKTTSTLHGGIVPVLEDAKINCLHISDSIIFHSNTCLPDDFLRLRKVCSSFLQYSTWAQTFPMRGCIVKGFNSFSPFTLSSNNQTKFINSSLYGKALVNAYLKAEDQDWSGCFIDDSAVTEELQPHLDKLINEKKLFIYDVPFKSGNRTQYTLPIIGEFANNVKEDNLRELFNQYMNGKPLNPGAELKLKNTIHFLRFIKDKL